MPELPEVETICRNLKARILNLPIVETIIYQHQLRWPIPKNLPVLLQNTAFHDIKRRAKYLLLTVDNGTVIIHLGLSGQLRLLPQSQQKGLHEHLRICFANQMALCYIDPRKFGAILWTESDPEQHPLLRDLGPEPLTTEFTADYLVNAIGRRKIPIKQLIMDGHVVVGVGNIYANEALFLARINPLRSVETLARAECELLVVVIKQVLQDAIKRGGTTIKDFIDTAGQTGHFQQELKVYGRTGKNCVNCRTPIVTVRLGQRSTFYCPHCQM